MINPRAKDALSRFSCSAESVPPPSLGAHHQYLLRQHPLPTTLFNMKESAIRSKSLQSW